MTRPIVLRTPKRRYWLVLDGGRYRPIRPTILRTRLREIGLAWCAVGPRGPRRPSDILAQYGAVVNAEQFAAAERGEQ